MKISPLPSLGGGVVMLVVVVGWGVLLAFVMPERTPEADYASGVLTMRLAMYSAVGATVGVHLLRSRPRVLGGLLCAAAAIFGLGLTLMASLNR